MKVRTQQSILRESKPNKVRYNPLKADPSRTGKIQRTFMIDIHRGYVQLRKAIIELVSIEDALGLGRIVGNASYFESCQRDAKGHCLPSGAIGTVKHELPKGTLASHVDKLRDSVSKDLGLAKGIDKVTVTDDSPIGGGAGSSGKKVSIGSFFLRQYQSATEKAPSEWNHDETYGVKTVHHEIIHTLGKVNKDYGFPTHEAHHTTTSREVPSSSGSGKMVKAGVGLFTEEASVETLARDSVARMRGKPWNYKKDSGAYQQYVIGLESLAKHAKMHPVELARHLKTLSVRDAIHEVGKILGGKDGEDALKRGNKYATEVLAQGNVHPVLKKDFADTIKEITSSPHTHNELTNNADWSGETNPRKVERFRAWLRQQMDSDLAGDELIQKYIDQSYRKGVNRAYTDANKGARARATSDTAKSFQDGAQQQFLKTTFSQRATVEKVKLLAGRTFNELEDVNSRMATKMSRVLVDGLVSGKGPDEIAKGMVEEVDIEENRARMICRTEIVRAHAEGQLDGLEAEGVEQLGLDVEWDISGGGNVCPRCEELAGRVFSIEDARGLIPLHPNCQCAWVPYKEPTNNFAIGSFTINLGGDSEPRYVFNCLDPLHRGPCKGWKGTKAPEVKTPRVKKEPVLKVVTPKVTKVSAILGTAATRSILRKTSSQDSGTPLTHDEKEAIEHYTKSAGFSSINSSLRNASGIPSMRGKPIKWDSDTGKRIKALDSVIDRNNVPDGTVLYRGLKDMNKFVAKEARVKDLASHEAIGKEFIDHGYGSTTLNPKSARGFISAKDDVILEIHTKGGLHGRSMRKVSSHGITEDEVLLQRGVKYKILGIRPGPGGKGKVLAVEASPMPKETRRTTWGKPDESTPTHTLLKTVEPTKTEPKNPVQKTKKIVQGVMSKADAISAIRYHEKHGGDFAGLAESLEKLPAKDLQEIKKELGYKGSGTKKQMATKFSEQAKIKSASSEDAWKQTAKQIAKDSAEYQDKEAYGGPVKTPEQWREHPTLAAMGNKLHIEGDYKDSAVQRHLYELSKVPEPVAKLLREEYIEVHVGDKTVPGMDDMGHMKGVTPRGWPPGKTWDDVRGCYDTAMFKVIAGKGMGGSISVALHEYGHAIGDRMRLDYHRVDDHPELIEHHKAIYHTLSPYLQQDGPGGEAGRQELLAEGFAHTVIDKKGAAKTYGEPFVKWIEDKIINYKTRPAYTG